MRHVFIINPVAGHGKTSAQLAPRIEQYFRENGGDYAIRYTTGRGDASRLAQEAAATDETVRVYSCGGDGTLHEVVNGLAGCRNVELGCFPCGSGNDYVGTFGKAEQFLDVAAQVEGQAVDIDLMETNGLYSINQCSMGFDAAVADNVRLFKGKPLISGSMAYLLSIFYTLCGKLGHELTVQIDEEPPIAGRFMFAISAKGRYQGGGIPSAPTADPTDGFLHFVTVRAVSHLRFLQLLPKYLKGTHLDLVDFVSHGKAACMRVTTKTDLPVVLDGEIIKAKEITTRLVAKAMRFVLPTTVANPAVCAVAGEKNF